MLEVMASISRNTADWYTTVPDKELCGRNVVLLQSTVLLNVKA